MSLNYLKNINNCELDKHIVQNTNKHYHRFQQLNREQKLQEIMSSGLNNLVYTILERKHIHDIVEIIKVEI